MNEYEHTASKDLWDATEAMLRRNSIVINDYDFKGNKYITKYPIHTLKG